MFDSILMRPNGSYNHPLDYGQLMENLFFYQHTHVHIGRGEICSLFDLTDIDVLVELLKYHGLKVSYNNAHVAVGMQDNYCWVDSIEKANLDIEQELYTEAFEHSQDKKKSERFASKLSKLIKIHSLPTGIADTLNKELQNDGFRNAVIQESFKHYHKSGQIDLTKLRFELEYLDAKNFKIHTNMEEVGADPKQITPTTPILALINGCADIHMMAEGNTEISVPEFNATIVRAKIKTALDQTEKAKQEIEVFSHYVFDSAWALREAINSKRIHVKAALQILRKADKYKSWLQELPNDANLMREYVNKVQEKTIFEKFPAKAIRFYLFNGIAEIINAANPAIAIPLTLAASAFDTFILDQLGKKWKPNQFIENELRPLVKNRR